MTQISARRFLALLRLRLYFLIAGGAIAGLGTMGIGLVTPSFYRSESLLQLRAKPQPSEILAGEQNMYLHRAANLAKSPRVLIPVAESLIADNRDQLRAIAPHSISMLDVRERWRIVKDRLAQGDSKAVVDGMTSQASSEILSTLMGAHIRVDKDDAGRTLRIAYEAGAPDAAQIICRRIVEEFIVRIDEDDQLQLKGQEDYLQSAIEKQLRGISELEGKMYEVVERYPQVSVSKGDHAAAAGIAQKYVEKQELLKRLESELGSNQRILSSIREDLARRPAGESKVTVDMSAKILEEIGMLEFKLLQYTRMNAYSKDHPEVQALGNRIAHLKQMLNAEDSIPGEEGKEPAAAVGVKGLFQQRLELNARNRRLLVEKENLSRELVDQSAFFKQILKVNFTFDSLVRDLQTNVSITNELYKDLQKTRLLMAGRSEKPLILASATLPIHSSNLSLRKRVVFGILVGIALTISLLLIIDLLDPLLLAAEDLHNLKVKSFGSFNLNDTSFSQIASCLVAVSGMRFSSNERCPVLGLFPVSASAKFEVCVMKLVKAMSERGGKIGLVVVQDNRRGAPEVWWGAQTVTRKVSQELAPSELPKVITELKEQCNWVFVVTSLNVNFPVETFVARSADYFLYVTEVGKTNLRMLERVRNEEYPVLLEHYALLFR